MTNDRKSVELKVGLTVISGLLILLFGILWGKNYRLSANLQSVSFLFQNTGGLRVNDPVTVNGVKKGHVSAIELEDGLVRVDVMLDREVKLFSDVRAYITTVELMGGKKVEIIPGNSGQLLELSLLREPLRGAQTAGFSEMLVGFSEVTARSARLLERLDSTITLAASFLDEATVRRPLVTGLNDLQATSASMRELLQKNQISIQHTITNLEVTAVQLREIMERRTPEIDSTLLAFNRTAKKLETFTATLDEISLRLQQRQGMLSQLIYDTETIARLQTTIAKIDSAATELRVRMGQFLSGSNFNLINLLSF
jgi:phospholipid/cholesterol/gamma-HCH transport system substrate-binding protein